MRHWLPLLLTGLALGLIPRLAPPASAAPPSPAAPEALVSPPVEQALSEGGPLARPLAGLERPNSDRDAAMIAFADGLRHLRAGRFATAHAQLEIAARSDLALKDQAAFFAAEARFHQGQYAATARALNALLKQHPHSPWRYRALARLADAELAQPSRRAQGLKRLRALLEASPEYPHPAAARLALGEAELAAGRLKAAATGFAELTRWSPTDPLAPVAERHLAALDAQGIKPATEPPEETLRRCTLLRERKSWSAALADLQRLLTRPDANPGIRLGARYQIGRTLYQMELFPEAQATFAAIEAQPGAGGWRRLAMRWRAYTLERLGQVDEAAELFLAASGDPKAPSAETTSKVAWLYFNQASYLKAAEWFDRLAQRGGKWAAESRFWRVWLAYRIGEFESALAGFKALQARSRWRPERYGYWVGRTLANLGELDAAADTWRGIVRSAPLSYYAYQARSRLIELGQPLDPEPTGVADPDADEGERVAGEGACVPADGDGCEAIDDGAVGRAVPDEPADELSEADREADSAEVPLEAPQPQRRPALRALAHLATGWGGAAPDLVAAYELAVLGELPQAALRLRAVRDEWLAFRRASAAARRRWAFVHRPFVDYRPDSDVTQWGRARKGEEGRPLSAAGKALFSRPMSGEIQALLTQAFMDVGDHHYVRRMLGASGRKLVSPPEAPANNAAWRRWYPRAFEELVRSEAAARGLEPYLIWALMNVESSYNPWAISRVGARGLMQVMPHTGRLVAEHMGRGNFGTALLIEPEVAIEQSAWYFEQLLSKFQGQLPLAIAGYNAGPHRVAAWLGSKGHLPMDEFIEEIPYAEAREYAKKVLRFLALYRRIYEGDARLKVSQIVDPDFRDNINF